MIVVENVKPTAQEMRPLQKGWGLLHWVICLPTYVPILAVIVFGITVAVVADGALPPLLTGGFIIGNVVLWAFSDRLARAVSIRAGRRSPINGQDWRWSIDADGIALENPLQSARLDWRGIVRVREEQDRFLFLASPQNNPVLPKRLLTLEQIEALRALIAEVTASGRLGRGTDEGRVNV